VPCRSRNLTIVWIWSFMKESTKFSQRTLLPHQPLYSIPSYLTRLFVAISVDCYCVDCYCPTCASDCILAIPSGLQTSSKYLMLARYVPIPFYIIQVPWKCTVYRVAYWVIFYIHLFIPLALFLIPSDTPSVSILF